MLIVFAIIISVVTYTWLKSYVPVESLSCPDGVSVFLKDATQDGQQLSLTLRNNGRFNLTGFFAYATNKSDQELENIDLSRYLNKAYGGDQLANSVVFYNGEELFEPNDEEVYVFDIPTEVGELYSIRVVPTRYQDVDGKEKFVSCTNARVTQIVGEPIVVCVDEDVSVTCGTRVCGSQVNNCGNSVICPPNNCGASGDVCNGEGQCVDPLAGCGNGVKSGTEACDDGNTIAGDGCSGTCTIEDSWGCSTNPTPPPESQCALLCGNGVIDSPGETCDKNAPATSCTINGYAGTKPCNLDCLGFGACTTTLFCGDGIKNGNEACDDGNTNDNDACKNDCTLSQSTDCSNNCIIQSYGWGYCTSPSSCTAGGGSNPFSGNTYCGAGQGRCCCIP